MPRNSPLFLSHQPFFDLGLATATPPLFVHRVEYAAQDMMNGQRSCLNVQRLLPESFRETLVQEAGLPSYHVSTPLDLDDGLCTPRWRYLNEQLRVFHQLLPERQSLVSRVLLSLGFHGLVQRLVPRYTPEDVAASKHVADLALIRAITGDAIHADYGTAFDPVEYTVIADNALPAIMLWQPGSA